METVIAQSLGRSIKAFRLTAGLTQEQLALAAGINRNYVSSLEHGQKAASLAIVVRVAIALGISPTELVASVMRDIEKKSERSSDI